MTKVFSINTLRGDLFGGLTAGIVALPLALAFGVASGAGAAAGLYGAIMLGMMAAIFGGTRTQISGPTGPMTVVFASVIVSVGGDLSMAMAAVLIAGLIQIIMGCLMAMIIHRMIRQTTSAFIPRMTTAPMPWKATYVSWKSTDPFSSAPRASLWMRWTRCWVQRW
ncbi:SulP family inorganic anion transporter [Desulfobotulus mexicanus]|uniref:SulP family inorganic anion transporter n=1 Tax=Desulfobotulus mexicanus TaxID=2586642 RepID=A0A5Q4VEH5_9BACT|nr:SulP family inorganic anion transporter [Desulfobotulus mexicanus]TYT76045.1 SulP family inorganic anion transporter [Desulfobotulus mexicanus]